jgi:undecaprenyl-diphosphatase
MAGRLLYDNLRMDASLFFLINGAHREWLDTVMLFMTEVGRRGFVWFVIAAIASLWPQHRAAAWRLVLALGLAFLVTDGVFKPLAGRTRPYEVLADARVIDSKPTTASFPSGHAASAAAGAIAASRMFPAAAPVFYLMAALVAASRVYVGVHYPADVVAGLLVGTACALFALGGRNPSTYAIPWPRCGVVLRP